MSGSSPINNEEERARLCRLEKVYAATTRAELGKSYAEWAGDYDRDVMAMGYMSPTLVAAMTARHVRAADEPPIGCRLRHWIIGIDVSGARLSAYHRHGYE
jgi:hypothetical protein